MAGKRKPAAQRSSRKPGVKRERIMDVATEYFGQGGYEDTKWADIAAAVGIGSTALYHYFESKQHCLYEIMAESVTNSRDRFEQVTSSYDGWTDALVAVLRDAFDLDERDILRRRVMVAELGRISTHRTLPREEAARSQALATIRDLEFAWGMFLSRGMEQGVLPDCDPRLLTRALLGLHNSVWHWFRPGGTLTVQEVGRFIVGRQLALLGCPPDLAEDAFARAA